MARRTLRRGARVHDGDRALRDILGALRYVGLARYAGYLPRNAGTLGRLAHATIANAAAAGVPQGQGHRRYRALGHDDAGRAGSGADPRRLAVRCLLLAADLLHQRTVGCDLRARRGTHAAWLWRGARSGA